MSDPRSIKTPSETETILARSILYRVLVFFLKHPSTEGIRDFIQENRLIWEETAQLFDHSTLLSSRGGLKGRRGDLALRSRLPRSRRSLAMTDGKNDLKKALTGVFQKLESLSASEWAHQYEDALGHTANSRIPAYELEYGEEHSHRQPDELADITAFYNAFGLQMMTQAHERPDHISVECEFMSYLLYKEAFALGEEEGEKREIAREAARKFLRDHLGRWLPAFAARLSKSVHPLMRAVGDLALEFILQDCALSGLEPGSLYLPLRLVQEGEETGCVSCKKC